MNPTPEWDSATVIYRLFCEAHPYLGLKDGKWPFHNLLRRYREPLQAADAIRLVNGGARHWIAHRARFDATLFELLTTSEAVA
jgi:hypothetical protein